MTGMSLLRPCTMRFILRSLLIALIVGASSLPVAARQAGELKTVIAQGVGAGVDKSKARDEALTDACRKAVEQGLGLYIKSDTLVRNMELISDEIQRESRGYVHVYDVISENYDASSGLYRVEIEAQVSMGQLRDDLDDLWERLRLAGNARIIVSIAPAARYSEERTAENEVIAYLVEQGFKVLDEYQLRDARQREALRLMQRGEEDAASIHALQDAADIVIVGKSTVRAAEAVYDSVYSVRATLNARVIRTDSALIIASASGTGIGVGFSREDAASAAIVNAREHWAKRNLKLLVQAIVDPCKEYQVSVSNCAYPDIIALNNKLADSRFTRSSDIIGFDNGYGKLAVQYQGDNQALATHLQTAAGIPLEIMSIKNTAVELRVTRP